MSAIAYHDAITKVLAEIRATQIGKIQAAGEAIEELGRSCRELRVLGSYPEGLSRGGA